MEINKRTSAIKREISRSRIYNYFLIKCNKDQNKRSNFTNLMLLVLEIFFC